MSATAATACHEGYRHEALFYSGHEQFMDGTLGFIREAISEDEPVLVVLAREKIEALRGELDGDGDRVLFADMAEVGSNPARIIPAWSDFVEGNAVHGRRLWGIGEPIWAGRSAAELAECQRHEALLNVVFSDPAFSLLCPYDTSALSSEVIEEALRNHPFVRAGGTPVESTRYPGSEALAAPFAEPLPDPPERAAVLDFHAGVLREVRAFVAGHAAREGLPDRPAADLVLAVNELVTNSVRHGGGRGTLQTWREDGAVLCEVRDAGRIEDPLVDRRRPGSDPNASRGLWLTNQLCDLVQVRSFATGNTVRLHMRPGDEPR